MAESLSELLRAQGGVLADLVDPGAAPAPEGAAQLAASGPRTAENRAEYELLLEMIVEGSRLHYGSPRLVRTEDPDLALLLGDQLYALGLARLAALGDMDAVRVLADTIAALAQAHAEGQDARSDEIWEAAARHIGWGAGGDDGRTDHRGGTS